MQPRLGGAQVEFEARVEPEEPRGLVGRQHEAARGGAQARVRREGADELAGHVGGEALAGVGKEEHVARGGAHGGVQRRALPAGRVARDDPHPRVARGVGQGGEERGGRRGVDGDHHVEPVGGVVLGEEVDDARGHHVGRVAGGEHARHPRPRGAVAQRVRRAAPAHEAGERDHGRRVREPRQHHEQHPGKGERGEHGGRGLVAAARGRTGYSPATARTTTDSSSPSPK